MLPYICQLSLCFVLHLLLLTDDVTSLRFFVPPNEKKCLKEEIHKQVTDTRGHTLYKREAFPENSGKFAFTADEYDVFQICFESITAPGTRGVDREVFLKMKHGVEAKDYKQLAQAEKLKPLEVELKRLEDVSASIVQDFAYMRQREEEMRDTNESTNSRVLYLSVFSMLCLLCLAGWQALYLRRYFKAKKLID